MHEVLVAPNNDDLNGSIVSIAVKRIDKEKKIVGSGIDIYMTPASNVKISTLLGSIYYGDSIPIINYKVLANCFNNLAAPLSMFFNPFSIDILPFNIGSTFS